MPPRGASPTSFFLNTPGVLSDTNCTCTWSSLPGAAHKLCPLILSPIEEARPTCCSGPRVPHDGLQAVILLPEREQIAWSGSHCLSLSFSPLPLPALLSVSFLSLSLSILSPLLFFFSFSSPLSLSLSLSASPSLYPSILQFLEPSWPCPDCPGKKEIQRYCIFNSFQKSGDLVLIHSFIHLLILSVNSSAQFLHLALHSGIVPSGVHGIIWDVRD